MKWIIDNQVIRLINVLSLLILLISLLVKVDTQVLGRSTNQFIWIYSSILIISFANLISLFRDKHQITITKGDVIFLTAILIGIFGSYIRYEEINTETLVLYIVLLCYLNFRVWFVLNPDFNYLVTFGLIAVSGIFSLWGILQLCNVIPSNHHLFKVTGPFSNPGPYGGFLASILPLSVYNIIFYRDSEVLSNSKKIITIFSSAAAFLILLTLPATMSRGAWVASIAGLGYLFYSKNKELFQKYILLLAVIILILAVLLYKLKQNSADGRWLIWKVSSNIIFANPTGVGLGRFSGVYGEAQRKYFSGSDYLPNEVTIADSPGYAFNDYVQIAVELGIIPLFLFIVFIIYSIVNAKIYGIQTNGVKASTIALLTFSFVSYPLQLPPFILTFIIFVSLLNTANTSIEVSSRNRFVVKTTFPTLILFLITFITFKQCFSLYKNYKSAHHSYQLFTNGFYKQASSELKDLAYVIKSDQDLLFAIGKSLHEIGSYEESNLYLYKATQFSSDPMIISLIGKNYHKLGNYKEADYYYYKASQMVPNRIYPHFLQANLYAETQDTLRAIEKAQYIINAEVKVQSPAVEEMKTSMVKLLDNWNIKKDTLE